MAESIGPRLEVQGEREFKSALQSINNEFKLLGSEMKLIASQYDKNDKSTEALTAKSQALGNQIDAQKSKISLLTTQYDKQNEKLTTLKTKLDATKAAFGADSAEVAKAQREYDRQNNTVMALQTQLNGATTGLNNMDRALQENNRNIALQESQWTQLGNTLNDVGDRMKKVGDGMKDVGKKMSTSITAPIMAVGAAAVAAFKDVDKGMDTVIKKTGATGETAKELEEIYKDLASSVPDSMEDVGAAVGEVNTRFEFTGDTLKKASEDFLKFARINDMDVNSSIQLVSRAMGDAGIESSEYGSVLDMLTVAAQKSGIGMEELTASLTKYGAPMRALGIDTETSIAMFAGWEKAGVNTEIAFSGMKIAIGKWGKEGKDSTKEFEKTLKAIKDAPDITTATGMAIETFGQRAGADLADAIQGGRFEIGDYVTALKNAGGTVESTYSGITDGTDDAKIAFNQIKVSASELGSVIVATLTPVLKSLGEKIKEVGEWFQGLSPEMKKTVLVIAGIAAAIGPVLVIVGTLISSVGAIAGAFGAASGAIAAAGGIIATIVGIITSPITLTIAAIAALAAIAFVVVKNWEPIKAFFSNLWTSITTTTTAAWDGIKQFFTGRWVAIGEGITSVWNGIGEFFSNLWTSITTTAQTVWNGIGTFFSTTWDGIKTTTEAVWNAIKDFFSITWNAIVSAVNAIIAPFVAGILDFYNNMSTGITEIMNGFKTVFTGIWDVIKNLVLGIVLLFIDLVTGNFTRFKSDAEGIFNNLKASFQQIWDGIKLIFTGTVDAIRAFIDTAWEHIKTNTTNMWNGIKDFFSTTWNNIKTTAETMWNGLKTFLSTLWTDIKTAASTAWETLKTSVISLTTTLIATIKSTWESILTWFTTLPSRLKQYATNMFMSMKDGVTTTVPKVKSAVVDGLEQAWNYIRALPSTALEWGKDIIQGLINGIRNKIEALKNKITDVTDAITGKIRSILGIQSPSTVMQEVGQYTIDGLIVGIGDRVAGVGTAMDGIVSAVASKSADLATVGAALGQALTTSFRDNIDYTPPRDGGYTIVDGKLNGGSGGSGSGSGGSKQYVDADGDNRIDYTEDEDGHKVYIAYHDGGFVGSSSNGMYGIFDGLKFDEVPAILQAGEFVLSKEMIRGITNSSNQMRPQTSNTNNNNSRSITQNVVINSPTPLTPSEVARQSRNAMRELALNF